MNGRHEAQAANDYQVVDMVEEYRRIADRKTLEDCRLDPR